MKTTMIAGSGVTQPPRDQADALCVRRVDAALAVAVRALKVAPAQVAFAGSMPGLLDDAEADPASEAMAILLGEDVIGYFRLDFSSGATAERVFDQASVGLRAFFIDIAHQGRGLGRQALQAMIADLGQRHPDCALLSLSVNCRNEAAISSYVRAGFHDHPPLHEGGPSGPQRVMLRPLHSRRTP